MGYCKVRPIPPQNLKLMLKQKPKGGREKG